MKRNNHTSDEDRDAIALAPPPSQTVPQSVHDSGEPAVNEAAIDLLLSWQAGDEQEQRDTWEYLERVLEEDRLSDRPLLP